MKLLPKPFSFRSAAAVLALGLLSLASPLVLSPRAALAQTALVSNLDGSTRDYGYFTGPTGSDNLQIAFGFTTGSTAYNLGSIQVYLGTLSANNSTVFSLALYNANSGNANIPGTLAVSLGNQTVTNQSTTPTLYTFTPSSAFVLAAGTRYVALVDYVSGDTGIFNESTTAPTARNGSGYSNFTYYLSTDDGATYPYNVSNSPPVIAVNGVAIAAAAPEPATLPLLGMGLSAGLGMVGVVKRRKAKKQAV